MIIVPKDDHFLVSDNIELDNLIIAFSKLHVNGKTIFEMYRKWSREGVDFFFFLGGGGGVICFQPMGSSPISEDIFPLFLHQIQMPVDWTENWVADSYTWVVKVSFLTASLLG